MAEVKQKVDFTEGKIFWKMFLFVLPIVATNLLQTFYNAADMMIVSLSDEVNAVGAVGITSSFINLIINMFIGFSVGVNVVISRSIGAKDAERAKKAVHTCLLAGLIIGVASAVIGVTFSRPLLRWMGNTGNLLDLAVKYTYFYFAGVPFLALTNYLMAIFRAKGDSKTPLIVLSIAGLLNVGLNLFFVLALRMSVEGVAIATAIANLFSFLVLILKLKKDGGDTEIFLRDLKIDGKALKDIMQIGFPAALQGALLSISNVLIQSSIVAVNNIVCPPNSKYQPVVNGCAAASNISGFVYSACSAVYQGAITLTGQNIGAKKPERIFGVVGVSAILVLLISLPLELAVILFRKPLLSLYGIVLGEAGSLERIAFDSATTQLLYACLPYFIFGIMEVGSGVLRGLNRSFLSMVLMLICLCVLRVIWILTVFPLSFTLETLFLCYPISWICGMLAVYPCIFLILRKMMKHGGSW